MRLRPVTLTLPRPVLTPQHNKQCFVRTALQAGRRSCVPVLPETDTRSCLKFAWSLHRVRLGEDLQLGISKDQRVLLTIRTFSFPSESRSPCAPSIDQSKSPHSRWLRTTGDLPSLSPYNSQRCLCITSISLSALLRAVHGVPVWWRAPLPWSRCTLCLAVPSYRRRTSKGPQRAWHRRCP